VFDDCGGLVAYGVFGYKLFLAGTLDQTGEVIDWEDVGILGRDFGVIGDLAGSTNWHSEVTHSLKYQNTLRPVRASQIAVTGVEIKVPLRLG
jgi:hypothetical protein